MQPDKVPATRVFGQGHESLLRVVFFRSTQNYERLLPNSGAHGLQLSVSFGEIFGSGGENSYSSDSAAVISNNLAKADPQKLFTGGSSRPFAAVRH
jgi:hypothetical protein